MFGTLLLTLTAAAPAACGDVEDLRFYEERVRPILVENCNRCHGEGRVRAGLDLVRFEGMDEGRIVPGKPDESLLYILASGAGEARMPPQGPGLDTSELDVLRTWIAAGAPHPEVEAQAARFQVLPGDRESWAFRPLERPPVPAPLNDGWSRTRIDRFVLRRLLEAGLEPRPEAAQAVLIRRLFYSVIGLPPTPEQAAHLDPDVAVEELLASPQHGERWARHWLDLARWAESTGYEADNDRPRAWPYRDEVIRAFADDLPFDQFVQWQIAGDELAPEDPRALALTGFLAAGPTITNEGGDKVRYEKVDDVLSTIGSTFLGMTMGCARCHDHKYDPISTRDYYNLAGAFLACQEKDVPRTAQVRLERDALQKVRDEAKRAVERWNQDARQAILDERIDGLELSEPEKDLLRKKRDRRDHEQEVLFGQYEGVLALDNGEFQALLTPAQIEERKALEELRNQREREFRATDEGLVRVLVEGGRNPGDNWLLARGDYRQKAEKLTFDVPEVLRPAGRTVDAWYVEPPADARTPWRRRAVALWLTDAQHGAGALVARVMVNRLWQHHFGTGLVATSGNFGTTGEAPSHPELLEWLACELVDSGWSLHHVHRLILRSATYRQGTGVEARGLAVDPDARLYWRRTPRRMEAEVWRDSLLAVSGKLNPAHYGPSIKPWMPTDAITTGSTRKWPVNIKDGPATWRRSLYIYTKRSVLMPMLEALDFPDSTISCTTRNVTTVAPAALLMMNNDFVRQQAGHFADRVRAEVGETFEEQVAHAWRLALGRSPEPEDLRGSVDWLDDQAVLHAADAGVADSERQALLDYCQVLLGLNAFLYVD